MEKYVRIANAGGYWGDDPDALERQLAGGPLDYVTIDYLAEITMVLLQKAKIKEATLGYATDFVPACLKALPRLLSDGVALVTNAGGVHPEACAEEVMRGASRLGLSPKVAVVRGAGLDPALFARGGIVPLAAYAYLGARPIAEALARGAEVVICGRVADAALTLGPLVHRFGWSWSDWDRLAAGVVAGHVLECGAQASGGNLTDWRDVPRLAEVGYPVVEVDDEGGIVFTKAPGSGGRVSRAAIVEQLLYEIGDPAAYATPDVTVDFRGLVATEEGEERVRVTGARGVPPPPTLKAGVSDRAGWKTAGTYLFGPPDAAEKGADLARLVWMRTGTAFDETLTEILGGEEAFVRLAVRDSDRSKLERFARRFASFALSGPPGGTIPGGGLPSVQEVFSFRAASVARSAVHPEIWIGGERIPVPAEVSETRELPPPGGETGGAAPAGARTARVGQLAFARSGDKGDIANIGVAARNADAFETLRKALTPDVVARLFRKECKGAVRRHELPGLHAFNFVLEEALGGGGIVSLRSDPQGKLFAQRLLAAEIEVP